MNATAKTSSIFDFFKWTLIIVLFGCGLAANYYYSHIPLPIRMIAWIVLFAVLLALAAWTAKGKVAAHFIGEARNELRRVVWPTKQETIQTTTIVVVMVVTAGLVLWGLDSVLMLFVSWLTG